MHGTHHMFLCEGKHTSVMPLNIKCDRTGERAYAEAESAAERISFLAQKTQAKFLVLRSDMVSHVATIGQNGARCKIREEARRRLWR